MGRNFKDRSLRVVVSDAFKISVNTVIRLEELRGYVHARTTVYALVSIGKASRFRKYASVTFPTDKQSLQLDSDTVEKIRKVLTPYRDHRGAPLKKAALLKFEDNSLFASLSEDAVATILEDVQLACFSALAYREFPRRKYLVATSELGAKEFVPPDPYCNSGSFAVFYDDDSTAASRFSSEFTIQEPFDTWGVRKVEIDDSLLAALARCRESCSRGLWSPWQEALSYFNMANNESHSVAITTELVLMCGAFQRLLGSPERALHRTSDTVDKFVQIFTDVNDYVLSDAQRVLVGDWMREFCDVRNNFAHGKVDSQKRNRWSLWAHTVAGAIMFPLSVRILLKRHGYYALSKGGPGKDDDEAQIGAFPNFLEEQLLPYGKRQLWNHHVLQRQFAWWGRNDPQKM